MPRPDRCPTSSVGRVARVPIVLGMVLLVAGGGVVGYAVTRQVEGGVTPEMSSRMDGAIKSLETSIAHAHELAGGRAKDLSLFDKVQGVIGTDATTALDMYNGGGKELRPFQPDMAGEVIELANADLPGGKPVVVLELYKDRDNPSVKAPPPS